MLLSFSREGVALRESQGHLIEKLEMGQESGQDEK